MENSYKDPCGHDRPSQSLSSTINKSQNTDDNEGKVEDWTQEYCKAMELGKIKHPSVYSFKDKPWITEECKRFLCIKLFFKKKAEKYKTEHYNQLLKIAKDKCKITLRNTKGAYEADQKYLESSKPKNSSGTGNSFTLEDRVEAMTKTTSHTSSSAFVNNPKAPVADQYPNWYDSKCKEMAVLKEYYQSILEINRNDVEAMSNCKDSRKKLKRLEKEAYRKFKAKSMKSKSSLRNLDEEDTEQLDEINTETLKSTGGPSWRHMNDKECDTFESTNSDERKKPPPKEKGKWQPIAWKDPSNKESNPEIEDNDQKSEDVLVDLNNSPTEEMKENPKRARYGQEEVEPGEISSDDFKNSSWQVFSSKEMKKRKRRKLSDRKAGNDDDDDSSMDVSRSPNDKNLNKQKVEENNMNKFGPGFGPTMQQSWGPNCNNQGPPGGFKGSPGPNFNNGGFQQPSGPGYFNQGPPGPGFNNQGPPRFNNQGPPMFNNQGPPGFNNQGPPGFNNQGPTGFNNQGPRGFNNQGPPGGFNNQGPPGGFNSQRPPGGFNNQGRPGGFNNQGPPGGFNNQGPPGGFNNQGPPGGFHNRPSSGFNNQGPPRFSQGFPNNDSGFAMHGPPRPPFNPNDNVFQGQGGPSSGYKNLPSGSFPFEQGNDSSKKEKSKHSSGKGRSRTRSSSSDRSDSKRSDADKFSPFPPPPFSGQ